VSTDALRIYLESTDGTLLEHDAFFRNFVFHLP
jgi:hypothetical protein